MRRLGLSIFDRVRSVPTVLSVFPYVCTRSLSVTAPIMADINKEELLKKLTPLQLHVTQEKGTERPFSGCYNKTFDKGIYTCVVCNEELFASDKKFPTSCGWAAFSDILESKKIKLTPDTSHVGGNLLLIIANPDMVRTEVTCAKCGAHLGHVFDDGPPPTRKRYCINSASMNFTPDPSSDGSSSTQDTSCGVLW